MPLPLPPAELFDASGDRMLSPGAGTAIAFGIGAASWTIVVAAALLLLRY